MYLNLNFTYFLQKQSELLSVFAILDLYASILTRLEYSNRIVSLT